MSLTDDAYESVKNQFPSLKEKPCKCTDSKNELYIGVTILGLVLFSSFRNRRY